MTADVILGFTVSPPGAPRPLSVCTSGQDGSAGLVNYLAMEDISDDAMFAGLFTGWRRLWLFPDAIADIETECTPNDDGAPNEM